MPSIYNSYVPSVIVVRSESEPPCGEREERDPEDISGNDADSGDSLEY